MFRFSVLVPFSGNTNDFEVTLASVLRYRAEHSEIIVAHDGTYDDPHGLAGEIDLVTVEGSRHLTRLVNHGVHHASGEFVVVARPGVELGENWFQSLGDAFGSHDSIGTVAPLLLTSDRSSKIVSAGIELDNRYGRRLSGHQSRNAPRALARLRPEGPTLWLAAYRRDVLEQIGAIDTDLDAHYLDAEIALSIKQLGFTCKLETEFVGTVESDKHILAEAQRPHGTSAQRAFQRHGKSTAAANVVASVCRDLIGAPLAPWLLRQSIQRFGASKWSSIDREFSIRMKQNRMAESWNNKNTSQGTYSHALQRRAA